MTARLAASAAVILGAVCFGAALTVVEGTASAQIMPDLVSRTALRVCADPSNLPFSNRKQQGFENKIAEIVANQLKEPLRYFWAPSGPGFLRNTLNADLCDVVMGYAVGAEIVQPTNPYYRSTYVLVAKKGSPLDGIQGLDDPKLKGKALGVFAATPPVDVMLARGLMVKAKVYPLLVDHRFDSPLTTMIGDLKDGTIDAAIVWGPLVGWDVKKSDGALVLSPLLKDIDKPGFTYRIGFGIRHDEPDWKHKLEAVIRKRRVDIDKVLVEYGVPMINDQGQIITPAEAVEGAEPAVQPASAHPASDRASGAAPAAVPPGFKMPGPPPTNAPTHP